MIFRHIFSLAVLALLSACVQMKWFGAGGNECEWDEINYKGYFESGMTGGATAATGKSDVPQFGACSDEDLANSTCK